MNLPFYVAPGQMVQDKAEYARKGIARGKSIVGLEYRDGILLTTENPSTALNKISEIYDHIAFAGVGKYTEFDNLRKAGIRYADTKGYAYSRNDVTAKSLANAYAEVLGNIFTREVKPLEVEVLVVEIGLDPAASVMYRVQFDGTLSDHHQFAVIGGVAERIFNYLKDHYVERAPIEQALRLCIETLRSVENGDGDARSYEVAKLDRNLPGRMFRRLTKEEVASLLA